MSRSSSLFIHGMPFFRFIMLHRYLILDTRRGLAVLSVLICKPPPQRLRGYRVGFAMGARWTNSPVEIGHCNSLPSNVRGHCTTGSLAQAANPDAPPKPSKAHGLACKTGRPRSEAFCADWRPSVGLSQESKRPASCGDPGPPVGAISRRSLSVKAGWTLNPQKTTESRLCVKQASASSTSSNFPLVHADF